MHDSDHLQQSLRYTLQSPADAALTGEMNSGACGYSELDLTNWPANRVVALGPNNTLVNTIGANKLGCGQCIRATCTSSVRNMP